MHVSCSTIDIMEIKQV